LHDVIETAGLDKRAAAELSERVREIVAAPVDTYYAGGAQKSVKRGAATGEASR
jgi:hypothetical protein